MSRLWNVMRRICATIAAISLGFSPKLLCARESSHAELVVQSGHSPSAAIVSVAFSRDGWLALTAGSSER